MAGDQKILVIEDEPDALELIEFNLHAAGFGVLKATDGEVAIKKAKQSTPALIVLDLMLPGIDGFEVCKILRGDSRTASIPIIMLTARSSEVDRVLGLELGADDYLTKPFSPRELVLRVKRLLRVPEITERAEGRIAIGPLCIDISRHEVTVKGKPINLTLTEFKLLALLAQRRGRVQSREQLLRDVWQYDTMIDTRTIDTHMRRLREKLGVAARRLDTIRGIGYRLTEE